MKIKFIVLITSLLILYSTIAYANTTSIYLNEKQLIFDVKPQTENNRVLVPLRTIFESLGASVQFDKATKSIVAYRIGSKIQLTIDSKIAYKNSIPITLDVPAKEINGRVLVPLRFIGESFNTEVIYDKNTNSVLIYDTGFVKNANFKPVAVVAPVVQTSKQPLDFSFMSSPYSDNNPNGYEETCIIPNSIGTPELHLFAVNLGQKKIVAFEFTTSFLDDFNRPVSRIGSTSTLFTGVIQNTSILPEKDANSSNNGKWYTFNLVLYEMATQVKMKKEYAHVFDIKVTKIKYSDGSVQSFK